MPQQTFNPYPDLGTQFSNGLDYIVDPVNWINPPGPIYVPPTLEDIIHAIIKYIDEELGYFASPMSIPVSIELKSVIYTAINNFINKPCISMYGGGQLPFVAMMTGPSFINNYTVETLGDHIQDIEDNITKACLSTEQQQPLLIATMIGKTTYDYFLTAIGSPGNWSYFFSSAQVSDIANLPFWVQASMQGALIGNRTTMRGMIAPTVDIVTTEIISAFIAALIVTAGKIIFKWVPSVTNSLVLESKVIRNSSGFGEMARATDTDPGTPDEHKIAQTTDSTGTHDDPYVIVDMPDKDLPSFAAY